MHLYWWTKKYIDNSGNDDRNYRKTHKRMDFSINQLIAIREMKAMEENETAPQKIFPKPPNWDKLISFIEVSDGTIFINFDNSLYS